MRIPARFPNRLIVIAVIALAVLVNLALFVLLGLRLGGDAGRYLEGADKLLQGQPLTARQQVYFGYICLLAAVKWLALDQRVVYVIQIAASCAATVAALQLGRRVGGAIAGVVTALVWILCYDIQKWNFYLLTESLFYSSVMVSCWLIVRPLEKRSHLAVAIAGLLVMASLRFNGFVFALVMLLALLFAVRGVSRAFVAAALVVLLLTPAAGAVSPFRSAESGPGIAREGTLGYLTQGQVIWETMTIPMPPAPDSSGSVAGDVVKYVAAHPVAVARLYAYRLAHYLFAWNPRFSSKHTLVTTAQWIAAYLFAAIGWLAMRRRGERRLLLLPALFVVQGVLVMLTVGDNDCRYSYYAAPSLFPFIGVGVSEVLTRTLGLPRPQRETV